MNQDKLDKLTPEQKDKLNTRLNQEYSITLKQRQWIVIYNILVSQQYRLGDARIVNEICDEIQKVAAIDTNIPLEEKEGVVLN